MQREKYLALARQYYEEKLGDAQCAFVAGSVMRGAGKPHSDIDIVVLYDDAFEQVRRESHIVRDVPIELFLHNIKSVLYYFDVDRKAGKCFIASMINEGVVVGRNAELANTLKKRACDLIESGPPSLSKREMQSRKYFICDQLDDLRDPRPSGEVMGSLAKLYLSLADFYLRAQGLWSGSGKGLFKAIKKHDEHFAGQFENIFQQAYLGDVSAVIGLAEDMLEPYGGVYWDGDCQMAPEDWKNFNE